MVASFRVLLEDAYGRRSRRLPRRPLERGDRFAEAVELALEFGDAARRVLGAEVSSVSDVCGLDVAGRHLDPVEARRPERPSVVRADRHRFAASGLDRCPGADDAVRRCTSTLGPKVTDCIFRSRYEV